MEEAIRFEIEYTPGEMPVERDAKIFEAGEYPDKGIAVSEADLDRIIENFTEVPVKVEHTDSPLDPLGAVKRVWRKGRELFARLAFPSDLSAFLERRGVRSLSVALLRDPLRLAEVSLVLSPRVPSAAMFADAGVAEAAFTDERDARIRELSFALREKNVEAVLVRLREQGKIVPASEVFAREILLKGDGAIAFAGGTATTAEMFEMFLSAQPPVLKFGEMCPSGPATETPLPDAEDAEILHKLGVSPEQVRRYN